MCKYFNDILIYCDTLDSNQISTNNTCAHSMDDVMRQPGEDPQRITEVCDDVGDVLRHISGEAGLHGHGLHPPGVEVRQR